MRCKIPGEAGSREGGPFSAHPLVPAELTDPVREAFERWAHLDQAEQQRRLSLRRQAAS
ncbi:hypothetical protein ACFU6R_15480 [Streptomyces sp. NPDC057499]|uniref:hypothetical protein n=1 Tax=Streptomyces sp. NPDC057499 TaxID=3346150 RepID=UPI0036828CA0